MSLQRAIEQLQAEIDEYGQGTAQTPKEGTDDWYILRAKSVGLTFLKRVNQLRLDPNLAAVERFFRRFGNGIKAADGDDS